MKKNVELKAYCSDPEEVRAICSSLGARLIRRHKQTDTYFSVSTGRLKLRQSDINGSSFIYYNRLDHPNPRESSFEIVPISYDATSLLELLAKAIGIRTTIYKQRDTYEFESSLINVDYVEGLGDFIEIEVDVERAGSPIKAFQFAEKLKGFFKISQSELIPWSYAELKVMYETSSRWRAKLHSANNVGTIFLLDGGSCSGKTTLAHRLVRDTDFHLEFVLRYCTRKPREGGTTESEYIFVSRKKFSDLAASGAFIEYRDFKFGMSYGFPWKEATSPLLMGINAIGIIDLGSVSHVKKVFPEAVTILVNTSVETIRNRLVRRGFNNEDEIEERLENARSVDSYKEFYDYVVENDEGMLNQAELSIKQIIRSHLSKGRTIQHNTSRIRSSKGED